MVAIVSGNSLGLSLSSLATLGQRGAIGTAAQGRGGEQAFVNVATGNLVLQDFDDRLEGRGLDIAAVRTYNSQGLMNDDNGDNWVIGIAAQRIEISGNAGAAGSTVTVTARDGARSVYTWDAASSAYVGTAGAGAFDTVRYDAAAAQFIWTDGDSGLVERYQANAAGRLVSSQDPLGNTISYAYNANGTLQKAVNANGEATWFDYSGTNLTQIRTVSGGVTTTAVRYTYDSSNRLIQVTVDLSPDDNSVADGKVYWTSYRYIGETNQVSSIFQSDGTYLGFNYLKVGTEYKIYRVADGLGAQTFYDYDTVNRVTTVTDALGGKTAYQYDAQGQLTQVRSGISATRPNGLQQVGYRYDASGNVTRVAEGDVAGATAIDFEYDARGNQVLQRDAAGNTIARSFDARNQLVSETVYAAPDPDGAGVAKPTLPLTTRYVYDAGGRNLLRFVVSPEGRVTEHRYDSYGQRTSTIQYTALSYDTSWLGASGAPTESQAGGWAAVQDKALTQRIDLSYDALGQLQSQTAWASLASDGSGLADGKQARTRYVFDSRGRLLQEISIDAANRSAITSYVYDGLGRVLAVTRPSLDGVKPHTTLTSYDDKNATTTMTMANGLVTISAYDRAGRLMSVTPRIANGGAAGTTKFFHDPNGRLLMTQDPDGVRHWMLYDEAGRKVADMGRQVALRDANNHVSGQEWDEGGNLVQEVQADRKAIRHAYDAFGNKLLSIDREGHRTWFLHDKLDRLVRTTRANGITESQRWNEAGQLVSTTNGDNETIRYSYDLRGNLVKTQLAMGQETIAVFDALNRKIHETDANGSMASWSYDCFGALTGHADIGGASYSYSYDHARQLIAQNNTRGQNQSFEYDAAGQLVRINDFGVGRTTTYRYDLAGRHIRETTVQGGVTYQDNHIAYDALGRIRWVADGRTAVTVDYDQVGNRTRIHTHVNDLVAQDSDRYYQYDAMNRQTVVDAVDAQGTLGSQGHRLTYDANGNRKSDESGDGIETYGYDSLNRLETIKRNGTLVDADAPFSMYPQLHSKLQTAFRNEATLRLGSGIDAPRLGAAPEGGPSVRLRPITPGSRMQVRCFQIFPI